MTLKAWKRRMMTGCFVLMPGGLLVMLLGATRSWGDHPMAGFAIGSVGLFCLAVGALLGKFGIAGPFPAHLERDT